MRCWIALISASASPTKRASCPAFALYSFTSAAP
jgi:hypothetical protein